MLYGGIHAKWRKQVYFQLSLPNTKLLQIILQEVWLLSSL